MATQATQEFLNLSLFSFQTPNEKKKCFRICAPVRTERQPIHFTMILDTSGSMEEEERLTNVKWSLKHILKYLTADDQISMIEFNDYSEILFKRVNSNPENKILIEHTINRIKADGGTNLSSSLVTARDCLYMGPCPSNMKQGIVLLTDGYANIGIIEPHEIYNILSRVIEDTNGASLTCIGYGVNHNTELMRSLATTGGGSYNMVQNLEDNAEVFAHILGGLISCYAQKVEIVLSGIYSAASLDTHYRVHHNYDLNQTTIVLGDIQSENQITMILPNDINSVTVKGFNLQTMTTFEITVDSLDIDTTNVSHEYTSLGLVNYYRIKTAQTIETIRQSLNNVTQPSSNYTLDNLRNRIVILRTQIENTKVQYPHPLYELLLEEILELDMTIATVLQRILDNNSHEAQTIAMETSQVLSQHSAYLSMGRGVRSHFTPATPTLRQLSRQTSSNPNLHTSFSNILQRHISQDISSQIDNSLNTGNIQTTFEVPPHPVLSPPNIYRNLSLLQQLPIIEHEGDGEDDENNNTNIQAWIPESPIQRITSDRDV